jgi:hypothetical protein
MTSQNDAILIRLANQLVTRHDTIRHVISDIIIGKLYFFKLINWRFDQKYLYHH